MNLIEKAHDIYSFDNEAIHYLTSFVVGGCEDGNVYNVFFETREDKYYYQTLDIEDYIYAQKFVSTWSTKRVNSLITAINRGGETIGPYNLSQKGVLIDNNFFRWEDTFLIYDGIKTRLKSQSTGKTYSIENTEDFAGYLIACLLSPSPTQEVKEAQAKWAGRDLISERLEKEKIETQLRAQAEEKKLFDKIFQQMFAEAINHANELTCFEEDFLASISKNEKVYKEEYDSEEESYENNFETESLLDEYGIDYIYHITHYSNLENILKNGLLAHGNDFVVENIDNKEVNQRRNAIEPIFKENLHSYVPFYFNPKNPMLYVNKALQENIIILAFDRKLLTKEKTIFTNGNAAKKGINFYNNLSHLGELNWECLNNSHWHVFENGKSERMAETLVLKEAQIKHLKKIYCFDKTTLSYISEIDDELDVEINKNLYF
jgi:hypothetical protein